MNQIRKKKPKRNQSQSVIYSVPVLGVLVVFVFLMTIAVWNIYTKARDTQGNLNEINASYEELYEREQDLAASVEALDTPFGVETEIRDKYGLTREGEDVVIIVEDKSLGNETGEKKESWWDRLKSLF